MHSLNITRTRATQAAALAAAYGFGLAWLRAHSSPR